MWKLPYQLVLNRALITQISYLTFQHGLFTTMHKYYSAEQWKEFAASNEDVLPNVAASSGTGENDFERLQQILEAVPGIRFICLDVANGYSQHFVEYVRKVRAAYPTHTIIVSIKTNMFYFKTNTIICKVLLTVVN